MIKSWFASIVMMMSMFSALPVRGPEWKKENMKYAMGFLPLVGIIIGAGLWLWTLICQMLGIGNLLFAAGMTLIPLMITGGIHMDGFCDTIDALASHASPERKREILKDPNAGAFAVIFAGMYLLAYAGFCTELNITLETAIFVGFIHMYSRSLGAMAGTAFRGSVNTGLLATFRDASNKVVIGMLAVWMVICAVLMVLLNWIAGIVCIAAGFICLAYLKAMAKKQFGGMSGDLAGYLITLTELVLIICFVITEKVIML